MSTALTKLCALRPQSNFPLDHDFPGVAIPILNTHGIVKPFEATISDQNSALIPPNTVKKIENLNI